MVPEPGSPSAAKERAEAVVNEARNLLGHLDIGCERQTEAAMLARIDFAIGATLDLREAVTEYEAAVAADRLPDPREAFDAICTVWDYAVGASLPDANALRDELARLQHHAGLEIRPTPVSAAVSPAEPPERSCVKCGADDISVTWHGAGEDHHTREHAECQKYGRDWGQPAEEHLCCVCRSCQYRWKEDVLDALA